MEKIHPTILSRLFKNWCGEHPDSILPIPHSGSKRRYYRLQSRDHKAIGAYNPNKKENKAFLKMTNFFLQENIPVPEIFAVHDSFTYYLQQDLGDTTLFSLITKYREEPEMVPVIKQYLREAIRELARIQIIAGRRMDFSMCHPYRRFNKSAILFDLEYFREHFLSQHKVHYHKRRLNKEFKQLAAFIGQAESHFFLYRDFQSRNIMLQDEHIFFIDYQGGRQGPLQYDLSSLLFQARANLPQQLREEMLDYYLRVARMLTPIDKVEFKSYFYAITLIRILQTLGAYGLRGLKEGKEHFIQSIPYALENLYFITGKVEILQNLPEMHNIILQLKEIKPSVYEQTE